MSPQTIPWILCGALCLFPAFVASITYRALMVLSKRNPTIETTAHIDDLGRRHVLLELVMLSRAERKDLKKNKAEGE